MGARHDGAAHFDPGYAARGHGRKAHSIFRHRIGRYGVLRFDRGVLVWSAVSRRGLSIVPGLSAVPGGSVAAWILDIRRDQVSVGGEPIFTDSHIPPILPAIGVRFSYRPDAGGDSGHYLSLSGPLLSGDSKECLP